jgi:NAD(P)-dependent dehydrogenase (short-subunit alcohol dehydrogenase family)
MTFENQTIILTGVGRVGQVGEVVARTFAERGAAVVLLDRTRDEVEQRAASIVAAGGRAHPFQCDLTDEERVSAVAAQISAAYGGRADALVNMAGGFAMSGPVAESDPAVLQRMLAINLTTAYLATRAFLPLLRPARGSVVYFASAAVLPGAHGAKMSAYGAAKAGVLALMRAVAEEERSAGVRANALAPNAIRTATNVAESGENARYVEREEVAEAVCFLCSDGASRITGQVLELR